ncbi:MAG: hypothetical protein ACP5U1_11425 [Desulfomonilaceae bacterium]
MNSTPENIARLLEEKYLEDFCRARNIRYFSFKDAFWMSRGMRLFSPWPSSRPISLSSKELHFMWKQGAMFLHYSCSNGKPYYPGYDLVVDNKNYDLDYIASPKRRHNIRWALKRCAVERISFDSLVKSCPPLIEDTHGRQGRVFNDSVLEMWKNYFKLAESNPLFEAWGSFVSNQLAAFHVCLCVGGAVHIEMTFSRTDLLKYHPVDALCFVSTRQSMAKKAVTHVSYGRRPITGEAEGLINFKTSMGFKKIPVKERVEINPIMKPLLIGPFGLVTHHLTERYSERSMYARMIFAVTSILRDQVN